jgi:Skp family chaperone for outer membrane proteins
MGRITKTTSADVASGIGSEKDQVDRLMVRLRRATDQVALGFSIQTAQTTLAKRYAAFTPTGDADADRATLAEFEQQATALLRKAQKQQRDNATRRVAGAAGIYLGT